MAANEEVIISIDINKGDAEKEVDNLTKKINDLTKANKDLAAQNKELAKSGQENSKEYLENSRQIEINKQKISEATATRKGLIQTLIAEDNSIKGLKVRNAELIKQRDLINTATDEGRAKIASINAEIERNNGMILKNSNAMEKQRANIGNYKSALDGLVPGLGGFIDGIQGATKAALTFIATPLGAVLAALGLAISAVTAYFKGSEEGQNKFNKIAAIGSAILEQFMNIVEDLGEAIVSAFENPKQAVADLWEAIKTNFVNRVVGLLELIPKIGQAIEQAFSGDFTGALKTTGDAIGKVAFGIENITDKVQEFAKETAKLVEQGIANGEKIAALNAKIDQDDRALLVSRQKTLMEVGKLREEAIQKEGEERKKVLLEAIALEEQLTAKEVSLAKTRLALAQAELEANGDDKEAKKAVAQATADLFAAESTAFQNTIKFRKEIKSLDDQAAADRAKAAKDTIAEDKRVRDEIAKAEREQFENNVAFLEEKYLEESLLLKEKYLNDEISKEEFEANMTALEVAALEQRKAFFAANGMETLAIDTQITDAKIKNKQKEKDAKDKLDKAELDAQNKKYAALDSMASAALQLFKRNTIAYKGIASAQVAMDTVRAAQAANTGMLQAFPGPWGIALGIAAAAVQVALGLKNIAEINGIQFARGGIAKINKFFNGGNASTAGMLLAQHGIITNTGGVLSGPSHAQGGIPFTVRGRPGFEAEGGEAIINKRSTAMFRPILSAINQAGGGRAFAFGGTTPTPITRFDSGGVMASQVTSDAHQMAQTRTEMRRMITEVLSAQPPTVVFVEDIKARTQEYDGNVNSATVI